MSFVGGLLGIGGDSGSDYKPEKATILNPATLDQANVAYNQSQAGLNSQENFLAALQTQNGIGNQANVFQQQQALANQFQGLANGNGPNPALQQLQNTTGQNVANQAALMASQRGVGANAGLLARQAAQQGSAIQQQAAGQGAVLRAQQQLAGLQGLQQQQGMLGNLAGQQVAQQANATTGYNQAAQSEQQNILNAIAQMNNANVSAQNNVNSVQGNLANTTAQGQQGLLGGALGGIGSALGTFVPSILNGSSLGAGGTGPNYTVTNQDLANANVVNKAHGGMVQHYAEGGDVQVNIDPNGPQSAAGRFLFSSAPSQSSALETQPIVSSKSNPGAAAAHQGGSSGIGGIVKGIGSIFGFEEGGKVPGKASVKGDSLKNDQVPAMLSPGEVVIPRHVMQSADPVGNAARFVQAVMAKNGMGGKRR